MIGNILNENNFIISKFLKKKNKKQNLTSMNDKKNKN